MRKQLNSRRDKIAFLHRLQTGRATVADLMDEEHSIWMQANHNGIYEGIDNKVKVIYTEEQFQAYCTRYPKQNIIVLRPAPRCAPITEQTEQVFFKQTK